MNRKDIGARSVLKTAIDARHVPEQSEIVVRDLTSGAQTVIGWKDGKAFSGADFADRPD
jgi:hypothetical protein